MSTTNLITQAAVSGLLTKLDCIDSKVGVIGPSVDAAKLAILQAVGNGGPADASVSGSLSSHASASYLSAHSAAPSGTGTLLPIGFRGGNMTYSAGGNTVINANHVIMISIGGQKYYLPACEKSGGPCYTPPCDDDCCCYGGLG